MSESAKEQASRARLLEKVKAESHALAARLADWRRDFHRYPEVAGEEQRTATRVEEVLRSFGLTPRRLAGTGVCCDVVGTGPSPSPARSSAAVVLRADLDALPIREANEADYASQHEGVMHACGHDGHTAMLLGAALVLHNLRHTYHGAVRLLFQPAEEGAGGARWMLDAGAFDGLEVGAAFAVHLWPDLRTGEMALRDGVIFAAVDQFTLTVKGAGGHGAAPHQGIDAIVVAGQVVSGLQAIVSRMVDPTEPVVITIGTIHGGAANNVLAGEVVMTGTVRTLNPALRERVPQLLERAVRGLTGAYGAEYQLDYEFNYPATINDPSTNEIIRAVGRSILGEDKVKELERSAMGSEDFAYYLERVPGSYALLGSAAPQWEKVYPPHHPKYDLDEAALPLGTAVLASSAVAFLLGWS